MILVDIDDTIADCRWREELKARSWDEYHGACGRDAPINNVISVLRALASTKRILSLTSRPEKFRTVTCLWLSAHVVPIEEVMMRPDGDWRPAPALKRSLVEMVEGPIELAIDSRDDVCATYRAMGLTTAQVLTWK